VFLLDHLYDKEALPKKEFGIMLEYIADLKRVARTVSAHPSTPSLSSLFLCACWLFPKLDENEIHGRLTALFTSLCVL